MQKIRERQLAAPGESENIQDLCRNELKTKKHTATEGLLWLIRCVPSSPLPLLQTQPSQDSLANANPSGLEFTCQALQHNLENPSTELADSFRTSYSGTLKPHHSFLVKPIFSAAMSACPYRKDFYVKLGDNPTKVEEELKEYLAALHRIVVILKAFVDSKEAKW